MFLLRQQLNRNLLWLKNLSTNGNMPITIMQTFRVNEIYWLIVLVSYTRLLKSCVIPVVQYFPNGSKYAYQWSNRNGCAWKKHRARCKQETPIYLCWLKGPGIRHLLCTAWSTHICSLKHNWQHVTVDLVCGLVRDMHQLLPKPPMKFVIDTLLHGSMVIFDISAKVE